MDAVLNNIEGAQRAIAKGVSKGLRRAGLILQRQAQLLVPVDYGVLKASAFTRAAGTGLTTQVNVGFTAAYALFVHENRAIFPPGMRLKGQPRGSVEQSTGVGRDASTGRFRSSGRGRYWDPQGQAQPKFLEEPFLRFGPSLNLIVKAAIRKELNL